MCIITDLLNSLEQDAPVRSVFVGTHWAVVCSWYCGMAAAITPDTPHGRAQVREAGRLGCKSARELAENADSTDPLEASIGMAAINSLLDVDESAAREINASEELVEGGRGKNVALVGVFTSSRSCIERRRSCGSSSKIRRMVNIRPSPPLIFCLGQTWLPLPAAP